MKSHRNENDASVQPHHAASREEDYDVDPMAGNASSLWLSMDEHRVTGQKPGAKGTYDEATLNAVSGDLVDVLQYGNSRPRGGQFALPIMYLEWAKLENIGVHYSLDTRLGFIDSAMKELKPVLSAMEADSRWNGWLQTAKIKSRISTLRAELNDKKAQQRIAAAAQEGLSPGATAEDPAVAGGGTDAAAKRARAEIATLLKATNTLTDLANKVINEKPLKSGELVSGNVDLLRHAKGALALDALNDTLGLASSLLEMTDDEFAQKQHILLGTPGFEHVRTRVDLTKAVLDLIKNGVSATAKTTRLLAMVQNKPELAAALERISDSKMLAGVGHVSTALSLLSSGLVLLDGASTDQQRIDAGVSIGTWAIALRWETAGGALGATYALASYSAELYWAARSGIMQAQTGAVFQAMAQDSDALVRASERLVITGALLDAEQDEGQKAALANIQKSAAETLGHKIDAFLSKSQSYTYELGAAYKVGSYRTLREAFAPHQKHAGKTDAYEVLVGSAEIIEQIAWCFENAEYLVQAETAGGGLAAAEAVKEEDTKKKAEEARRKAETRRYYDSLAEGQEQDPEGWSVDDGGGV